MYIKLNENGNIFPYRLTQLRTDFPQVSFPLTLSQETLAEYNVFPVTITAAPEITDTQVSELSTPSFSNGSWSVAWEIRDKTPDEIMADRQKMRVFKRALNLTLSQMPVSTSPNLSAAFPQATNLLQAVDMYEATLNEYDPLRLARRDITEYIRLHPDVDAFKQVLGVTDAQLDELFRAAISLENI